VVRSVVVEVLVVVAKVEVISFVKVMIVELAVVWRIDCTALVVLLINTYTNCLSVFYFNNSCSCGYMHDENN
jgi:hypothetical protein